MKSTLTKFAFQLVTKFPVVPVTNLLPGHHAAWSFGSLLKLHCREDIYRIAEKTKEDVGTVSILVNNAGIVSGTTVMDTPDSKIVKTFEVNVLAHFWTIKVRKTY